MKHPIKVMRLFAIVSLVALLTSCSSDDAPECSGSCGSISSCDSRYDVKFVGCNRKSDKVVMTYTITNNGESVDQLKLWQHTTYTYFTTDDGQTFNKERGLINSKIGKESGIGDLSVAVGKGKSVTVTHTISGIPSSVKKFSTVRIGLYNYGTYDWKCSSERILFYDVTW